MKKTLKIALCLLLVFNTVVLGFPGASELFPMLAEYLNFALTVKADLLEYDDLHNCRLEFTKNESGDGEVEYDFTIICNTCGDEMSAYEIMTAWEYEELDATATMMVMVQFDDEHDSHCLGCNKCLFQEEHCDVCWYCDECTYAHCKAGHCRFISGTECPYAESCSNSTCAECCIELTDEYGDSCGQYCVGSTGFRGHMCPDHEACGAECSFESEGLCPECGHCYEWSWDEVEWECDTHECPCMCEEVCSDCAKCVEGCGNVACIDYEDLLCEDAACDAICNCQCEYVDGVCINCDIFDSFFCEYCESLLDEPGNPMSCPVCDTICPACFDNTDHFYCSKCEQCEYTSTIERCYICGDCTDCHTICPICGECNYYCQDCAYCGAVCDKDCNEKCTSCGECLNRCDDLLHCWSCDATCSIGAAECPESKCNLGGRCTECGMCEDARLAHWGVTECEGCKKCPCSCICSAGKWEEPVVPVGMHKVLARVYDNGEAVMGAPVSLYNKDTKEKLFIGKTDKNGMIFDYFSASAVKSYKYICVGDPDSRLMYVYGELYTADENSIMPMGKNETVVDLSCAKGFMMSGCAMQRVAIMFFDRDSMVDTLDKGKFPDSNNHEYATFDPDMEITLENSSLGFKATYKTDDIMMLNPVDETIGYGLYVTLPVGTYRVSFLDRNGGYETISRSTFKVTEETGRVSTGRRVWNLGKLKYGRIPNDEKYFAGASEETSVYFFKLEAASTEPLHVNLSGVETECLKNIVVTAEKNGTKLEYDAVASDIMLFGLKRGEYIISAYDKTGKYAFNAFAKDVELKGKAGYSPEISLVAYESDILTDWNINFAFGDGYFIEKDSEDRKMSYNLLLNISDTTGNKWVPEFTVTYKSGLTKDVKATPGVNDFDIKISIPQIAGEAVSRISAKGEFPPGKYNISAGVYGTKKKAGSFDKNYSDMYSETLTVSPAFPTYKTAEYYLKLRDMNTSFENSPLVTFRFGVPKNTAEKVDGCNCKSGSKIKFQLFKEDSETVFLSGDSARPYLTITGLGKCSEPCVVNNADSINGGLKKIIYPGTYTLRVTVENAKTPAYKLTDPSEVKNYYKQVYYKTVTIEDGKPNEFYIFQTTGTERTFDMQAQFTGAFPKNGYPCRITYYRGGEACQQTYVWSDKYGRVNFNGIIDDSYTRPAARVSKYVVEPFERYRTAYGDVYVSDCEPVVIDEEDVNWQIVDYYKLIGIDENGFKIDSYGDFWRYLNDNSYAKNVRAEIKKNYRIDEDGMIDIRDDEAYWKEVHKALEKYELAMSRAKTALLVAEDKLKVKLNNEIVTEAAVNVSFFDFNGIRDSYTFDIAKNHTGDVTVKNTVAGTTLSGYVLVKWNGGCKLIQGTVSGVNLTFTTPALAYGCVWEHDAEIIVMVKRSGETKTPVYVHFVDADTGVPLQFGPATTITFTPMTAGGSKIVSTPSATITANDASCKGGAMVKKNAYGDWVGVDWWTHKTEHLNNGMYYAEVALKSGGQFAGYKVINPIINTSGLKVETINYETGYHITLKMRNEEKGPCNFSVVNVIDQFGDTLEQIVVPNGETLNGDYMPNQARWAKYDNGLSSFEAFKLGGMYCTYYIDSSRLHEIEDIESFAVTENRNIYVYVEPRVFSLIREASVMTSTYCGEDNYDYECTLNLNWYRCSESLSTMQTAFLNSYCRNTSFISWRYECTANAGGEGIVGYSKDNSTAYVRFGDAINPPRTATVYWTVNLGNNADFTLERSFLYDERKTTHTNYYDVMVVDSAGSSRHYYVKEGDKIAISAVGKTSTGAVFDGWAVSGNAQLSSVNAASSMATVYSNTTITATYKSPISVTNGYWLDKGGIKQKDGYVGNALVTVQTDDASFDHWEAYGITLTQAQKTSKSFTVDNPGTSSLRFVAVKKGYTKGDSLIADDGKTLYRVSVSGGSGSGFYAKGDKVTVCANDYYAVNGEFKKWKVEGVTVEDTKLKTSMFTFTMPENSVDITISDEVDYVPGDADGNGEITLGDVLALRKYIAGIYEDKDVAFENADVNGDGELTLADVLLIRKYIAGIIESFD